MRANDIFRLFTFGCLSAWLLAGAGCRKDKLKSGIPAYLYIPSITLTTDNSTQGSNANAITDAWVLVDGKLEGVFGLPANFPLLYEGKHKIEVFAGVRRNGSANFHVIYPVYTSYITDVTLEAEHTDTIYPGVTYKPETKFMWLEDFEDQAISLEKNGQNTTDSSRVKLTNQPSEVFNYGSGSQWSWKVSMDSAIDIFEYATKDQFDLPKDGREVYLEVNVKSNQPVQFGIYAISSSQFLSLPVLMTYSSTEWKKFYISLRDDIAGKTSDTKFKVFVGALNLDNSVMPEIYLDNFKLVYVE